MPREPTQGYSGEVFYLIAGLHIGLFTPDDTPIGIVTEYLEGRVEDLVGNDITIGGEFYQQLREIADIMAGSFFIGYLVNKFAFPVIDRINERLGLDDGLKSRTGRSLVEVIRPRSNLNAGLALSAGSIAGRTMREVARYLI